MKKILSLICLGLLFAFTSCSNDDGPDHLGIISANDFIENYRANAVQKFTLNTSELPKTLTLAGGSKITIQDGTFTKNGVVVTGSITLEVYEMLTPSSIIFSGTNTNYWSGKKYFITDGFLYVNATQNGANLDEYLAKNMRIAIPTDKANGEYTNLWPGIEDAGDDEDQFGWVDLNIKEDFVDDEDIWGNIQEGNIVRAWDGVFQFSFGKLGWFNCDVLWQSGGTFTTVTIGLTGNVGTLASYLGYSGNTFVFFCGEGFPIVAQLYTEVNATTVKSYDNSMPVGAKGKMIAFSIIDGKFSFASQEITVTENMQLTLNLVQVEKETLENSIKALDGYGGK